MCMKSKVIIAFYSTLLVGCLYNSNPASDFIANLERVDEISIYVKGVLVERLSSQKDIDYFLNTFKPTKKNTEQRIDSKDFQADGKIDIKIKGKTKVVILLDKNLGYLITINDVDCYEHFTYRTGRYISEVLYDKE